MVARDGGSYNGALSGGDDDGGFEFTTAMAVLVTLVCMFVARLPNGNNNRQWDCDDVDGHVNGTATT